ncbi:MAG: dual CXXC motif small (seleno)protein [Candidatus Electronema sp. V4]|uniref:dual CXXC motif small (seleno)protein n=1 Tax=Candidatus Electronema sp. V4 TaxID=3454756 RepID=UPI0040553D27
MQCRKCGQKLEVVRRCRQVRLRCEGCGKEYRIHEVAADLDADMEKQLERHTSIIYD